MKTRSKTTKASTAAKAAKTTRARKTTRATAESTARTAEANGVGAIRAPIQLGGRMWWPVRVPVYLGKEMIELDGYSHDGHCIFERPTQGGQGAGGAYLAVWSPYGRASAGVLFAFDSLRAAAAAARIDEAIGNLMIRSEDLDLVSSTDQLMDAMFLHLGFRPTGQFDIDADSPVWHLPPIEEMRDLP